MPPVFFSFLFDAAHISRHLLAALTRINATASQTQTQSVQLIKLTTFLFFFSLLELVASFLCARAVAGIFKIAEHPFCRNACESRQFVQPAGECSERGAESGPTRPAQAGRKHPAADPRQGEQRIQGKKTFITLFGTSLGSALLLHVLA